MIFVLPIIFFTYFDTREDEEEEEEEDEMIAWPKQQMRNWFKKKDTRKEETDVLDNVTLASSASPRSLGKEEEEEEEQEAKGVCVEARVLSCLEQNRRLIEDTMHITERAISRMNLRSAQRDGAVFINNDHFICGDQFLLDETEDDKVPSGRSSFSSSGHLTPLSDDCIALVEEAQTQLKRVKLLSAAVARRAAIGIKIEGTDQRKRQREN